MLPKSSTVQREMDGRDLKPGVSTENGPRSHGCKREGPQKDHLKKYKLWAGVIAQY